MACKIYLCIRYFTVGLPTGGWALRLIDAVVAQRTFEPSLYLGQRAKDPSLLIKSSSTIAPKNTFIHVNQWLKQKHAVQILYHIYLNSDPLTPISDRLHASACTSHILDQTINLHIQIRSQHGGRRKQQRSAQGTAAKIHID